LRRHAPIGPSRKLAGLRIHLRARDRRPDLLHRFPMILLFIVFCPIIAAALILLGSPARTTALIASGATLVAAIGAFIGFKPGGFNYITTLPISSEWQLNFSLGVDG